jgi:hypothetical protein
LENAVGCGKLWTQTQQFPTYGHITAYRTDRERVLRMAFLVT